MAKSASKSTSAKRRQTTARSKKPASKKSTKSKVVSGLPVYPVSDSANDIEGHSSNRVGGKLPSAWKLSRQAVTVLWRNRRDFGGIAIIYAGLSLLLVESVTGSLNIGGLRQLISGGTDRLSNGLITFEWLISGAGTSEKSATGLFGVLLFIVTSLAIIWGLRRVMLGKPFRVRDSFYQGMYPIIPVTIVMLIIVVLLLPLLIGFGVFNLAHTFGFAESIIAMLLWGLPALGLAILSLLMVTPAIIAVYIATLPGMEPMQALRAARKLVRYRRWTVLRKLLYVPLAALILLTIILVPALLLAPLMTPLLLFALGILAVPLIHTYVYLLYRELLA